MSQLESVWFNEVNKEDIDRLYSILRRTDLAVHLTKVSVTEKESLIIIDAQVPNLDLRTTTKEIKELKSFANKFQLQNAEYDALVARQ
jgi:hypothetical protein